MLDSVQLDAQAERSSGSVTATLTDEAGAAVTLAAMTSLTLTLFESSTRTILNSRKAQNVLNANNVTMHATSGLVTWAVQPDDMAIVTGRDEIHFAYFTAKWSGGAKEHTWRVLIPVVNLDFVS